MAPSDLRAFPPPTSAAGLKIIDELIRDQKQTALDDLYQQSVQLWKTDWQCALSEALCKLNPEDNQKLILWLSANISDGRKDSAEKLHAFISQLPLNDEDRALWLDVNVHFSLLNNDVKAAKKLTAELHAHDPKHPISWPKIAIMKHLSEDGSHAQAAKLAYEVLRDEDTMPNAYPLLLETLLSGKDTSFVTEFCLRYAHDEETLSPEIINIGARSMLQSGRADLALQFLLDHAHVLRDAPYAWFTLRECALKLDRYDDASAILEEVYKSDNTDDSRFRRALLQVDLNDLDGAAKTLSEFDDDQSEWAAQLKVLIASQQPEMKGAEDAYAAFLDHSYPRTNAAMIYAGNLLGQARTTKDLHRVNHVLEAVEDSSRQNTDFMDLRIKSLIAAGDIDAAQKARDGASDVLKPQTRDRFDQYFKARAGKQSEARQLSHIGAARVKNRAVHNASALPVATTFNYDPERDQILCFCCVFNGIEFASWFLEYYRALGVDHFFFVDNASTDGTGAYLAAQSDVSLFTAEGSFKASAHGVYWINDLMKSYAFGKWSFFVDMDEAFVFPMMDQGRSLHDLLDYFDAQGFECTPSLMIDMFSDQGEGGSFEQNCYFDNSYLSFPTERAPYTTIQGGFRTRMTGRNMLITKSPLVKVGPAFSYIENNHFHTHLAPSDVTTGVLHYKFVGDVNERINEALERKEHFLGATFYKDLKRAIHSPDTASDSAFSQGPDTECFTSAQDLVEVGVMTNSVAWVDFVPAAPVITPKKK